MPVYRRSVAIRPLFVALLIVLAAAPAALAQGPVDGDGNFGHDDARDGTATEIVSGFGPDGALVDPLAQRFPNTFEYFDVTVPPGGPFASFTVDIRWQDPRVDLDMYIYRQRPNGTFDPEAVGSSAQGGTNEESASIFNRLATQPLAAGSTYRVFVDNWCSRDADPDPTTPDPTDTANCGIGAAVPDEDDFVGGVTFNGFTASNRLPTVSLAGPDSGATGQLLTFTAAATDDDGITSYSFDLDGDGRFEVDAGASATVSKRYDTPGTYNVGVRAVDGRNGAAFANRRITVTGAPLDAAGKPLIVVGPSNRLLASFKLGRPVFGGRRGRSLVVRYRLRERARVELRLMRGKRTIRRVQRTRSREARRNYRLAIRPRGLRPRLYTVQIVVRASDGRRQVLRLQARRL